jgi:hypothetical protein
LNLPAREVASLADAKYSDLTSRGFVGELLRDFADCGPRECKQLLPATIRQNQNANTIHRMTVPAAVKSVVISGVFLSFLVPTIAAKSESLNSNLAQAQIDNLQFVWMQKTKGASPMSRCMATWGPSTQMSKQEWLATCKRVVKRHPDLYRKRC